MMETKREYQPGVSIVLCCYNSSARLPVTLKHLAKQKISSTIAWEIIVVDNASSDDTALAAQKIWTQHNAPTSMHIVRETTSGLAFAKKKGVQSAKYEIVIFCDDDNWLDQHYVQTAAELLWQNADIGAAGGVGRPVSDMELPDWFSKYRTYYACYPQADKSGALSKIDSFLYGAGMAVRTKIASQIFSVEGNFILTGRSGEALSSGEDNEFCYLIRLMGYQLWYSELLGFQHFMPPQRLTKKYLFSLVSNIAYSSMRLIIYHYILANKKVDWSTWVKDVIYRTAHLVVSYFGASFNGDELEKRIVLSKAWQSWRAVVSQVGQYRTVYKRLLVHRLNG